MNMLNDKNLEFLIDEATVDCFGPYEEVWGFQATDELFEEVRQYLKKLDNMITDYVDDTFEITTGIPVRR